MTQPPDPIRTDPNPETWPPGSCPDCGHRWADHDEHDGCGACALEFTRSCGRWPDRAELLAEKLHQAACACGDTTSGQNSYWLKIARAAIAELAP